MREIEREQRKRQRAGEERERERERVCVRYKLNQREEIMDRIIINKNKKPKKICLIFSSSVLQRHFVIILVLEPSF